MAASGTVSMREYWVNLLRPASPSSWYIFFSEGTMMVRSCMMIELVMYGPTPSIIMERLESPPPEKIFNIQKNWLPARNLLSSTASIPGIGIAERSRKTTSEKSTKMTLRRRDMSVQINFIFAKKFCITLLYFYSAAFDAEALAERGKALLLASVYRNLVFAQNHGLAH